MHELRRDERMQLAELEWFVAEIAIPAAVHAPLPSRLQLPTPERLGANKGYVEVNFTPDEHEGVPLPNGLVAVVQLLARSITEAEDITLHIGDALADIAALYASAPKVTPQLRRIARCNEKGSLIEQWDYFYNREPPPSISFSSIDFQSLAERLLQIPEPGAGRVNLALRWYRAAIAAADDADRYLAAWIGLEAIGPLLDSRWHPDRSIGCRTCSTEAGKKRDSKIAGAEHLVRLVAPDLIEAHAFSTLLKVRGLLAHAIPDATALLSVPLPEVADDLVLSLGRGFLTAIAPLGGDVVWSTALPRDYGDRPASRGHVESPVPLTRHQPYFGGWIEVERDTDRRVAYLDEEGSPHRGEAPILRYDIVLPRSLTPEDLHRCFVWFGREGIEFVAPEGPGEAAEVIEWRPRLHSSAWIRAIAEDNPSTARRSPGPSRRKRRASPTRP